jgi:MFS family permease
VHSRTAAAVADPSRASADLKRQLGWALRALCLTEIVSWGILYYAFPVLSGDITADTGWSHTQITAVFSAALIAAALSGIPVGRVIHRHGPRWLMTGGSVLASGSIVGISQARSLWLFALAWLVAGVAMAGVLYAPAFAAVTVWFGPDRVRALTAITLVAGLASTVFAPLTAALNAQLTWRGTYLVLAGLLAVLTVPLHLVALRPDWPQLDHVAHVNGRMPGDAVEARREFVLLATGFSLSAIGFYATVVNLVPLLQSRGFSASTAALVLGAGGIGQVAGRLGYAALARRVPVRPRTALVLGIGATTTLLLALVPGPAAALVAASVLAGNARGIATLLQATAVSDRWGVTQYARLNGIFGAPLMVAGAVAPFVGAGLASLLGNYPRAFVCLAVAGLVGAAMTVIPRPQVLR